MGQKKCPWCGQEFAVEKSMENGSHGKLRIEKCVRCGSLTRVRLDGEPEEILKKGLVKVTKEGESLHWVDNLLSKKSSR